jgi:MFS transporter, FHS family, glucose/mannose:H+ symporter
METKPFSAKTVKIITIGAFLAFFLFGYSDNLKGATLPVLLDDLNFSYSLGGTVLLASYLGFLIATLLTGPLSDRAGKKVVIFLACAALLVGMLGYSRANLFWTLSVAMFIIGLGLGSLEIGANLIIVDIHREDKGRYLNLLAFFHGIGSMIAPLLAGQMLVAGFSWRQIYQFSIGLVLLVLIYFLLVKYPRTASAEKNNLDFKKLGRAAFSGEMILFYVGITVYVAAEIGIGAWLVEFLQNAKSQSVSLSTTYLAVFFGTITVGRFIGSFLVNRVGYLKSMLTAGIAAMIFVGIGTFTSAGLAIFVPLAGLFFSIIFPTLTAAVSDLHEDNVGTILGLLFTFAGLGGMLGPWAVGIFSDWLGMNLGFGMILIFLVGMNIVFGSLLTQKNRSQTTP